MKKALILFIAIISLLAACGSDDLEYGKATDVRNDKTGNWKKVVTSKKFDVEDVIEYKNDYMKDNEVHYVVSFATNTTTVIRDHDSYLSVDVTEYKDKEEHDAATIGDGMLLARYNVKDNGEVEELNTD